MHKITFQWYPTPYCISKFYPHTLNLCWRNWISKYAISPPMVMQIIGQILATHLSPYIKNDRYSITNNSWAGLVKYSTNPKSLEKCCDQHPDGSQTNTGETLEISLGPGGRRSNKLSSAVLFLWTNVCISLKFSHSRNWQMKPLGRLVQTLKKIIWSNHTYCDLTPIMW